MVLEQSQITGQGKDPDNTGRQQDGRFRQGVSGNPAGRPKGARNRSTRLAEAMLDAEAETLMRQAIDLAKAGDVTALRLCIERLVPRRLERSLEFELPALEEPKDAVVALSRITEGVGQGELTASEAASLVNLVQVTIKALEVLDLDRRLSALEARHAQS